MNIQKNLSEFANEPDMVSAPVGAEEPAGDVIGAHGSTDREGAMAKADLYKLASYAHKLYQQIDDNDQLEAWVQAKITKAADYVASVYHFLEYEMKFSEYGHHLDNSDTLSESQKAVLKNKLNEARQMVKQLKLAQAGKVVESDGEKRAPAKKTEREVEMKKQGGGTVKVKATKVQGWQSQKADKEAKKDIDESSEEKRAPAKKTERETTLPSGAKVKTTKVQGWQSQKADKEAKKERDLEEASDEDRKPAKVQTRTVKMKKQGGGDVDVNVHKVQGWQSQKADKEAKKDRDLDEAAPSADLTKKEKSAVVKKAKKGGDIGKPGKGFAKVEKAAKKGGAKDPKAVAAAAMWKNVKKEAVEQLAEKKTKPDYIDLDKDGDKKEPMKKAAKEKETVKESADLGRMKQFLGRLLG